MGSISYFISGLLMVLCPALGRVQSVGAPGGELFWVADAIRADPCFDLIALGRAMALLMSCVALRVAF